MIYKIYKLGSTTIGRQEIVFLEDIGHYIEWSDKSWERDTTPNSFKSIEDASAKMDELFKREKEEEWEELSINRHDGYTILPIK